MKILYVSRENAPGDHGGAVHTWQVASLLAAKGHAVSLLCHRQKGEPDVEIREGVAVRRADIRLRGRSFPFLALPALWGYRGQGFGAVMERFDTFGGLGALCSRSTGAPLLLEVNYPHLEEMIWKWRHRGSLLAALRPFHRLLATWNLWQYASARVVIAPRASIVPSGHRHKVELVHWGANPKDFHPVDREQAGSSLLRQRLGLEGRTVVVSHGSFQPWHATGIFPEIIARVAASSTHVAFLLVGCGRGLEQIEKRVAALGLGSLCRFPGHVSHREMPDYLGLADVALAPFDSLAYPPLEEFGFYWSPAKLFEYMACGVPIVTTDQDYLRQVVEGEGTGWCLPQNDAEALAQGVLRLADDPERRRQMGAAGRQAVLEKYSWQAHVEQLARILERLAVENRPCQ